MLILVILSLINSLGMVWDHPTEVYIFKALKFTNVHILLHPARLLDRPEYMVKSTVGIFRFI